MSKTPLTYNITWKKSPLEKQNFHKFQVTDSVTHREELRFNQIKDYL